MNRFITYVIVFLLCISCYKKDEGTFSSSVEITPSYSVPIGNFLLNINNYLYGLDTIVSLVPDSIYFNDTLFPNPLPEINRTETYPVNLSSITEDFNNIRLLFIRVIFYNGYPTSFSARIHLSDENGNVILTLPENNDIIVPAAETDNNGIVTGLKKHIEDIEIQEDFITSIQNVRFITTEYTISTQDPNVFRTKFFDYYNIKLHIGARFQLTLSS